MLEMRLRDPRFALLGPRSGAQAAVQSATVFAFEGEVLAGGAFACLSLAPLLMNVWEEINLHHHLTASIYHARIVELSVYKFTHVRLYYEMKLS